VDLEGVEVVSRDLGPILYHLLWPARVSNHGRSWDSHERYAAEPVACHLTSRKDAHASAKGCYEEAICLLHRASAVSTPLGSASGTVSGKILEEGVIAQK
jgi:hypothetical protein